MVQYYQYELLDIVLVSIKEGNVTFSDDTLEKIVQAKPTGPCKKITIRRLKDLFDAIASDDRISQDAGLRSNVYAVPKKTRSVTKRSKLLDGVDKTIKKRKSSCSS